jgi:hypothetical protein
MTAVAARYGERGGTPYLLPLSVDGLVAAAGVSLVELASRIRINPDEPSPAASAATGITSRPQSDRAISATADRRVNRRPASGQPATGRPTVTPTDTRRRTRSGAPRTSQPSSPPCADATPRPPQPRSPNRSDDPCGRYYGSSSDSKTYKPTNRDRRCDHVAHDLAATTTKLRPAGMITSLGYPQGRYTASRNTRSPCNARAHRTHWGRRRHELRPAATAARP